MTDHPRDCDKGPAIEAMQETLKDHGVQIKAILEHQIQAARDTKEALDKLTSIIIEGNTTRLEVEQGKKERALLFTMVRSAEEHLAAIDVRNAKCDGAGIFNEWPAVRKFINEQKGVQRFIPYALTIMTGLMTLYNAIEG